MPIPLSEIPFVPLKELYAVCSQLRQKSFGSRVELCSIVNIKSGRCAMNCRFCAQSGHYNTGAPVYPMLDSETLKQETRRIWKQGVKRVGWVASGSAPTEQEFKQIIETAETLLAENNAGFLCSVSIGQLDETKLRQIKNAGFLRIHHNLETSERFYPSICTTQKWRDRYETVKRAKDLGLDVCSGGIFGLGETWQDRTYLALMLKELDIKSVPLNFIRPVAGTPLANQPPLMPEEALRITALFRIALPSAALRLCGGRPQTLGERQTELFAAGADSLMTGDYLTTTGCGVEQDMEMIRRQELMAD
ncbi:MAG: biotin synthase BioB [Planctomycetaceae bacterium]|nr:biotin synthase BioB [Planctomycetaceae bacterium]